MDKKKLVVNPVDTQWDSVTFQDQVIKVKKMLSPYDIMTLVRAYLTEYFSEGATTDEQIMYAELSFKSVLFDVATDHSLETEDFNKLLLTSVFDDVSSKVSNLPEARKSIEKAIEKKSKEHSIEVSFSNIVGKIMETLDYVSSLNISKDTVDAVAKTVEEAKALEFGNHPKPAPRKRKAKK